MRIIQTIADIEELKARTFFPLPFLRAIETQFLEWYEAEGNEEPNLSFRLPYESCIKVAEEEQDVHELFTKWNIEFVEKEASGGCEYYRIGIMNDHQMSLVYLLQDHFGGNIESIMEGLGEDNHYV
ncbi:hypothetical protein ACFSO7_06875 [Bacillus sp. CGMCC 1.16607]|uniref:hypothetical protein n=1 Tax=Bacillus sp. CGMCC 1.16607 TaxID=3351842 RepID=UPI00362F8AD4